MGNQKRWTKEEETVLLSHLADMTNNLTAAFKTAAEELNRTPKSVQQHWYTKLQSTNKVFITVSTQKKLPMNKKISRQAHPIKKSIWRKLLDLLFKSN